MKSLPLVALSTAVTMSAIAACSSSGGGAGGASAATTTGMSSSHESSSSGPVSVSASSGMPLPQVFTVTGTVRDDAMNPLPGAFVMQGGGDFLKAIITAGDGRYSIDITQAIPGTPTVVAGKILYRDTGVEFVDLPSGDVDLVLSAINPPDNIGYHYGAPGVGDAKIDNSTKVCGHCHTTFVKLFQTSMHAKATKDPLVQDLYAGVTESAIDAASCGAIGGAWRTGTLPGMPGMGTSRCYAGGGVLSDLNATCGGKNAPACDDPGIGAGMKPVLFGRCADCHAPGIDGKAGGRDLLEADALAFDNGNHCDVCHHARDVDLQKPPGVAGALILQRPGEHQNPDDPTSKIRQAMFGPLPDVPNGFMGGSYAPVFKQAELCGACHEQRQEALITGQMLDANRWPMGLPTHSTYSEWKASAAGVSGTVCQECHMPKDDTGLKSSIDVANEMNASIAFGFVRPPEDLRKHIFRHPLEGSPRFIDSATSLAVIGFGGATSVDVTVDVQQHAGHAMPTGEPMRALVLVVTGDACGAPLVPSGGMTINDVGGAKAEGVIGVDATMAPMSVTWAAGAARAKQGDVVRVVHPTGMFDDYAGVGFFANPVLKAKEKGLEIRTPVGEATVMSVNGNVIALSGAIAAQAGDKIALGEALPATINDGDPARDLEGALGYTFARVLTDAQGARNVPHYRAVDMLSDNRVPADGQSTTTHSFARPPGCAKATVAATLLYRPIPVEIGRARGVPAADYVIATATTNVVLP